ncbi:hypothetical protein [Cohnella silvisoli]|uniref:Uncharacterized protein n=1 Tax=Cohnella silvisoli TaxID=2873699 RepID=A0ABV1KYE0_9BACL|nr:hypothetical protein [Cohnella silvisoli]MCD9021824.1 hypothetical protein [Cohnella silvisoli]
MLPNENDFMNLSKVRVSEWEQRIQEQSSSRKTLSKLNGMSEGSKGGPSPES